MSYNHEIAQNLLQIKAINLNLQNPFTWASGMRSPIYCDNRISLSHVSVRNKIKNGLVELSKTFAAYDYIAGVATAGIAHGALMADTLNLPFGYVRSTAKSHGMGNSIEGRIHEGAKILVVEDLISTGKSSLEAVQTLLNAGFEVVGVIAIFDYKISQTLERFKLSGVPYASITDYPTLLLEAQKIGYIEEADMIKLSAWSQDPINWFDNIKMN